MRATSLLRGFPLPLMGFVVNGVVYLASHSKLGARILRRVPMAVMVPPVPMTLAMAGAMAQVLVPGTGATAATAATRRSRSPRSIRSSGRWPAASRSSPRPRDRRLVGRDAWRGGPGSDSLVVAPMGDNPTWFGAKALASTSPCGSTPFRR